MFRDAMDYLVKHIGSHGRQFLQDHSQQIGGSTMAAGGAGTATFVLDLDAWVKIGSLCAIFVGIVLTGLSIWAKLLEIRERRDAIRTHGTAN
jgi:hypothetical protein